MSNQNFDRNRSECDRQSWMTKPRRDHARAFFITASARAVARRTKWILAKRMK